MPKGYFKGYWMVTNRCNLDCSYCVLEDAPDQLRRELDLAGKMELVSHLYHALGFRRLTLSGGEVTLIGKRPPAEFLALLRHLRGLRSPDPVRNLEVEVYTNGAFLDETVADEMGGVVDTVAVTIDSSSNEKLRQIGRNTGRVRDYFGSAVEACAMLTRRNIEVKLHTVVASQNIASIAIDAPLILDAIEKRGGQVGKWKFYQYMSYDDPLRDSAHAVSPGDFLMVSGQVERVLRDRQVSLHFKDNSEMASSLFNILSYGNAQFLRPGDSWTTSQRTRDLRTYSCITELFTQHEIDEPAFRRFHELAR